MNLGASKGDLTKGSKALQKAGEQESKAGEFQDRTKGVAKYEGLYIAVGPNAQVYS